MKEYFSHDFNARNDRKMVRLMMAHGMEGVGVYWCIVEMLYEEQGRLMRSECERIAFELRVQCDLVESVIADFGLFESDANAFWSASVDRRIQAQINVREGAKKAAASRWEKYKNQAVTEENATAMQTHSERNANKEKKSKVKESKIYIEKAQTKEAFWDEIENKGLLIYPQEMLKSFFNYWSETNAKGKMRYQMEKTFEIPNRLATWKRNDKNWSQGQAQKGRATMQTAKDNFQKGLEIILADE